MPERSRLVLLLAAILCLAGCASNAIEVSVQTRAERYREIEHPRKILFASPPATAVLPSNAGSTPGFGVFMNTSIEKVLREAGAEETVIGPTETGNVLSEMGLRPQLDALMNSWQPSNVLDPEGLAKVGEALGVRFLLVPYLVTYNTNNNSRITFLGVTFVRTGWTTIQVALQLWHTPTGTMVWQGQGISTLGCEGIIGPPVPTGPTIEEAIRPMLEDFITGRSESIVAKQLPLPKPDTTKDTPKVDDANGDEDPSGAKDSRSGDRLSPSSSDPDESNAPITRSDEGDSLGHPKTP